MGRFIQLGGDPVPADVLSEVVEALRAGGVAVIPTDTVYGIAQSVLANPQGPRRIFEVKRRDASKVVPWLIGSPADLDVYGASVPAYAHRLAREFWPGGLTLVVDASPLVPPAYRAADGTVALRVPDCAPALAVIRALRSPLAATSANTSGLPAPVDPRDLEPRIVEEADVTLAASKTQNAEASTIVACRPDGPEFVRVGALSKERILQVLHAI